MLNESGTRPPRWVRCPTCDEYWCRRCRSHTGDACRCELSGSPYEREVEVAWRIGQVEASVWLAETEAAHLRQILVDRVAAQVAERREAGRLG